MLVSDHRATKGSAKTTAVIPQTTMVSLPIRTTWMLGDESPVATADTAPDRGPLVAPWHDRSPSVLSLWNRVTPAACTRTNVHVDSRIRTRILLPMNARGTVLPAVEPCVTEMILAVIVRAPGKIVNATKPVTLTTRLAIPDPVTRA